MSAEITQTKAWVAGVIVKYNICPFARAELERDSIRYVQADSSDTASVLAQLIAECQWLDDNPQTATTLLIVPSGYDDFYQYLDLLDMATELLALEGYEGIYQLASFHPDYCFAGSHANDPANYTNRAPYPVLHILREADVSRVMQNADDADDIVARNIEFARRKGADFFVQLLKTVKESQPS
ncbi:DUF1415 domain-containing protein [Pseudidiomarina mangrovi]|uniref:DUF1415 domain-containing protein n=1 Tax=Pseudidiomarina mangrovi TaxID=2487133 RepID=UPI000FCC86C3|nr:DUF1415 domain-containing protein [Pseudidiomarina mangrovi]